MNLIPSESVGSVPRSRELQEAMAAFSQGNLPEREMNKYFDEAVKDFIIQLMPEVICLGQKNTPHFH